MKKRYLLFALFIYSPFAFCQLIVDNSAPYDDVNFLVNNVLLSSSIQADNIAFSGHPVQLAYFDGMLSNIGFDAGIVLSTEDIAVLNPNFSGGGVLVNQDISITDNDLLSIANSVPDFIGQNFMVSSVNDIASIDFDFTLSSDSIFLITSLHLKSTLVMKTLHTTMFLASSFLALVYQGHILVLLTIQMVVLI